MLHSHVYFRCELLVSTQANDPSLSILSIKDLLVPVRSIHQRIISRKICPKAEKHHQPLVRSRICRLSASTTLTTPGPPLSPSLRIFPSQRLVGRRSSYILIMLDRGTGK